MMGFSVVAGRIDVVDEVKGNAEQLNKLHICMTKIICRKIEFR